MDNNLIFSINTLTIKVCNILKVHVRKELFLNYLKVKLKIVPRTRKFLWVHAVPWYRLLICDLNNLNVENNINFAYLLRWSREARKGHAASPSLKACHQTRWLRLGLSLKGIQSCHFFFLLNVKRQKTAVYRGFVVSNPLCCKRQETDTVVWVVLSLDSFGRMVGWREQGSLLINGDTGLNVIHKRKPCGLLTQESFN